MMRSVHLHGRLKKQFGASHRFDVATAAETLRALNCAFPGDFLAAINRGHYKIVRGDKRSGMHLDLELVGSFNLGMADLHIIPVAAGAANSKGVTKTIVGAALVGAAIFASGGTLAAPLMLGSQSILGMTWGNIAAIGLGLALSGVSTMLAGNTALGKDAAKDDSSFTINGPSNVAHQGAPIPLIYGEVITGGVTVSFDADIEDIGAYTGAMGSLGTSVQAVRNGDGTTTYFGAGA